MSGDTPTPGSDAASWEAWISTTPVNRWCKLETVEVSEGHYVCRLVTSPLRLNPNGAVNGAVIAAVIDHCVGAAAATIMWPKAVTVTVTLDVEYQLPARLPLTFTTDVLTVGSTLVFVETRVTEAAGALCNHGRATLAIRRVARSEP